MTISVMHDDNFDSFGCLVCVGYMSGSAQRRIKSYSPTQHEFSLGVGCLFTTPSMFGKFSVCPWRCCGGLTKDILYQFIEGQSHFGMPRGAKMSLAHNGLK